MDNNQLITPFDHSIEQQDDITCLMRNFKSYLSSCYE